MLRLVFAFKVIFLVHIFAWTTAAEKTKAEPCTDFFAYVSQLNYTGERFSLETKIPLSDSIENYFRTSKTLSKAEKVMYDFQKICQLPTLEEKINFARTTNFPDTIGGWPAFDNKWTADKFDLQGAVAELRSTFIHSIFIAYLDILPDYSIRLFISHTVDSELLDQDYRESFTKNLSNFIDNAAEVIGDCVTVEEIYRDAKKSVNVDDESFIGDVKTLKAEIPEFNWDKQIAAMYGQTLPDDLPVYIPGAGILKEFISNIMHVDPRIMANYFFFKLVTSIVPDNTADKVFPSVAHQILIKQYYQKQLYELRSMLYSFFRVYIRLENLSTNDDGRQELEKKAKEFIDAYLLPDINDEIIDNIYDEIDIQRSKCISISYKMAKISYKEQSQPYLGLKIDPLLNTRGALLKVLSEYLPKYIKKPSPYKFITLFWGILDPIFYSSKKIENYRSQMQCMPITSSNTSSSLHYGHDSRNALIMQVIAKAYFEWSNSNAELVQREEERFGINSKQVLFERLLERTRERDSYEELNYKEALLRHLANMKEFVETYNCSTGCT